MLNWLRNKLRAWLADSVESSLEVTVDEPPPPMSIAQGLLIKAGEKFMIPHRIQPPKLPDVVRGGFVFNPTDDPGRLGEPMLAYDDAANAPAWAYMTQANCGVGFAGYGYLAELSQRSEYRAPTETVANEMTREWIDVLVKGKASKKKRKARGESVDPAEDSDPEAQGLEDKIEQMEAAMEKWKLREHFRKLAEVDGFFGRAQLFINVDSGSVRPEEANQLPLVVDPATIGKGSLRGFKVIEPIWTSPYNYNATDPTAADFYKPRAWFVIGRRVHASRLLTFISREVPDLLKPAYNFGGLSTTQLMEPYVFQWLRTRNSVSDLVHNFSVMCLQTDMGAVLAGGDAKAGIGLMERVQLFVQNRDNQGLSVLDKNREELVAVNVPLGSLDKLQAQSQEHMAAPSHIPLVKLTGITPAGLNADSEGEIKIWYDWIRSLQIFFYGPHLKHCLDIIQLDEFGAIDDAISFRFVPLSSPTIKELSEIRKSDAETDEKYVQMGAVSPDEVRERISSDPNSGFDNLSGDAPPPPQQLDAEHGAGLQEEGAQADHERGEESAQAAFEREMKVAKDSIWNESDHPRGAGGKFGASEEFERAYSVQQQLENEARAASSKIKQFDTYRREGLAGLIPDEIKNSVEYKEASTGYAKAVHRLRQFNSVFVKKYKKELSAARAAKKVTGPSV